jgi:endonuclease YncB( thermonuclease family)
MNRRPSLPSAGSCTAAAQTSTLVGAAVLVLTGCAGPSPDEVAQPLPSSSATGDGPGRCTPVARVIDGDTIVMADGTHVRTVGDDAPETTNGHHDCGGPQATDELARLIDGRPVTLTERPHPGPAGPELTSDEDDDVVRYLRTFARELAVAVV